MSRPVPHDTQVAERFMENRGGAGGLHDFLGFKITSSEAGVMTGELEVRDVVARDGSFPNEPIFWDSNQFPEEPLRVVQRTVVLPGSETRWTFAVASTPDETTEQLQNIRFILIWSFAVLGLGLIFMAMLPFGWRVRSVRMARQAPTFWSSRIMSETFSPIMMAGALVLPETISGMIEQSATRSP